MNIRNLCLSIQGTNLKTEVPAKKFKSSSKTIDPDDWFASNRANSNFYRERRKYSILEKNLTIFKTGTHLIFLKTKTSEKRDDEDILYVKKEPVMCVDERLLCQM
jgi:hypothetical protein